MQTDTRRDGELASEALDGSHQAFHALVDRHQSRLWRVVLSIVSDGADAQDVIQDALVAAWQGLTTLRDRRQFGAWILGIAANKAKAARRDSLRRAALTATMEEPRPATSTDLQPTDLWDAIDTLPAPQRQAVMLHYVAGYTYAEMASALDVTPTAVRGRLHRARLNLRTEYLEMVTDLHIELDAKLLQFLRHCAGEQDLSVSEFVARLLTKYRRGHDNAERMRRKNEDDRVPVANGLDASQARKLAHAFFDACLRDDFAQAATLTPQYDEINWEETDFACIVEIIELGEPYQVEGRSYAAGKGVFVPYAVRFENGHAKQWQVAVRCDNDEAHWRIDGGL